MGFAEQMRAFTNEVHACAEGRTAALAAVSAQTEQFLQQSRAFLQRTAGEHKARAKEVRTTLAANQRERQEQMRAFRNESREQLARMRHDLNQMLGQSRSNRHEKLGNMMTGFATARRDLAADLSEAGRIWRGGPLR